MANKLWLPTHLWQEIVLHVNESLPNEACGLIGGLDDVGKIVLPVPNELNSPTEYRMKPEKQLEGFMRIEELNYILLAIYHSHPDGPPYPSQTDIAKFFYPGIHSLILSKQQGSWQGRLFQIVENSFEEICLLISEDT